MAKSHQQQVDENFAAFQELLPELLCTHAGKFVVMHDGAVVELFDSLADAVRFGHAKYRGVDFSVQQVTSQDMRLGFYGYVWNQLFNRSDRVSLQSSKSPITPV